MSNEQFYTIMALSIVVIILLAVVIFYQVTTSKYISGKKFKIKTLLQSENESNEEKVTLYINNPNFIDARILGFGYVFKNHTIDYQQAYQTALELEKVIIPARELISYEINKEQLINNVRYFNKGAKKVSKFKAYVIDHQGEITTTNCKIFKKIINECFKEERLEAKNKLIELKKSERELAKKTKTELKILNKARAKRAKEVKKLNEE